MDTYPRDTDDQINEYNYFCCMLAADIRRFTTALENYNRAERQQPSDSKKLSANNIRTELDVQVAKLSDIASTKYLISYRRVPLRIDVL